MLSMLKIVVRVGLCLAILVCASCLSASLPKSAKVEPTAPVPRTPSAERTESRLDKGLVDTWELLYQVGNNGDEKRPRESTRTLIEFTGNGQVIFNRLDRENSHQLKSRTGKYTLEGEMINIVDDMGNSVRWPYQLTGDTLIIVMPELEKKFYWRRFR